VIVQCEGGDVLVKIEVVERVGNIPVDGLGCLMLGLSIFTAEYPKYTLVTG